MLIYSNDDMEVRRSYVVQIKRINGWEDCAIPENQPPGSSPYIAKEFSWFYYWKSQGDKVRAINRTITDKII